jgi:hypothetical protein
LEFSRIVRYFQGFVKKEVNVRGISILQASLTSLNIDYQKAKQIIEIFSLAK